MAAAKVGTSSLTGIDTHSSLIGSAKQKLSTARISSTACILESSALVVNSTHQLKRVRLNSVVKRVDSVASNPNYVTSERNAFRSVSARSASSRNDSPNHMASGSGDSDEDSGAEDSSGVHLGRRAVLGTLVAAVALSRFEKPGVADVNGEKSNSKSKGGEKGKAENAGPGENWRLSRVYDTTALGEPVAVGGERSRVWEKLLQARVVYLGEAERVPDEDDRVLPNRKP